MNITKDIRYIGVNDHEVDLFEGQYVVPNGMSYNSYVILDEKVAVMDTIDASKTAEWLKNIEKALAGRQPDYLVVQHMEPDHSGSIIDVVNRYPNVKIIGNTATVNMIKGFYGLENKELYQVVKDGECIDLGGKSLKFVMTPMVHWPETMMTYVCEDNILFTGDAFGTFGALNGAVVDFEMNTDIYFHEMYRYYSNIVGKYGVHVQRALTKVSDLNIQMICPTHGPVWKNELAKVVELVETAVAKWVK